MSSMSHSSSVRRKIIRTALELDREPDVCKRHVDAGVCQGAPRMLTFAKIVGRTCDDTSSADLSKEGWLQSRHRSGAVAHVRYHRSALHPGSVFTVRKAPQGVCSDCCGQGVRRGDVTCPGCRGEKYCPASGCEAAISLRKITRSVPSVRMPSLLECDAHLFHCGSPDCRLSWACNCRCFSCYTVASFQTILELQKPDPFGLDA